MNKEDYILTDHFDHRLPLDRVNIMSVYKKPYLHQRSSSKQMYVFGNPPP